MSPGAWHCPNADRPLCCAWEEPRVGDHLALRASSTETEGALPATEPTPGKLIPGEAVEGSDSSGDEGQPEEAGFYHDRKRVGDEGEKSGGGGRC